ncbi:MAG: acyl carrier protein [Terriglobia bacterium]
MNGSTLEQVLQIASDTFNVPLESLTSQASPETIENWDSLQHLNLVLDLESRFGLHFSPEEIDQMRNVAAISSLIDRKLSQPGENSVEDSGDGRG